MGYNIEVSFDILKNSSICELHDIIEIEANKYGCNFIYDDYEFELNSYIRRNHCIMTINFVKVDLTDLLKFIKYIRREKRLYLELIYDENKNSILYASRYYITQKMNKKYVKLFKEEKRERSYSDDEIKILETIKNI